MNEENEEHEDEYVQGHEHVAALGDSILDRLKRRRQEMGQDRTTHLDVPGYNNELVVEYGLLTWEDVSVAVKKAQKSKNTRADLYGQVDILVKACRQVYLRAGDELKPLDETDPVKFDSRLAAALGFTATSARQVLIGVFQNELAISFQHGELMEWIQGTNDEEDETYMGESEVIPG